MKFVLHFSLVLILMPFNLAVANQMAESSFKAQTLDELIEKVRQDSAQSKHKNQQREALFIQERNLQKTKLAKLKVELKHAEQRSQQLRETFKANEQALMDKERELQQESGELSDVFAVTRQNAAELQSLMSRSMVSAQFPHRADFLNPLLDRHNDIITLSELKQIWLLLLDEMNQSGKVVRFSAPVITAQGEEQTKTVLRIGTFTATSGGHFLRYLPETAQLLELARQPSGGDQNLAFELENADDSIPHPMAIDPTKGSILALLVQSPDVWEQIRQGGNIGYLILILGAIGLLIVVYRYLWLSWTEKSLQQQNRHETASDKNPLGRLILAAQNAANNTNEALTLRLEETLYLEANRLKFGLTTLTVFAAVAPLLGLLGTVTGMIETFQSISLYGTGDPKLMSSGISQALITTQLGLAVAIPLLLLHAFLHGKASRMIDTLEAQSVQLFETHSPEKPNHV